MFPRSRSSSPACASRPRVRSDSVSLAHRCYHKLRLPALPPHTSLRLGRGYHLGPACLLPATTRHRHCRTRRGWVSCPRTALWVSAQMAGPPVSGEPRCVHALVFHPGATSAPGHCSASVLPSVVLTTSAPAKRSFGCSITRAACSLSTLRSGGYPTPRKTRFRWVANP